jgi:hypothetical protein
LWAAKSTFIARADHFVTMRLTIDEPDERRSGKSASDATARPDE